MVLHHDGACGTGWSATRHDTGGAPREEGVERFQAESIGPTGQLPVGSEETDINPALDGATGDAAVLGSFLGRQPMAARRREPAMGLQGDDWDGARRACRLAGGRCVHRFVQTLLANELGE